MNTRPERPRITTELGMLQTPPDGPAQFTREGGPDGPGGHVLLLGIGPDPAQAAALLPPGRAVYAMEAPGFKAQMPPSWHAALPGHWRLLEPGDLDEFLIAGAELWVYRPGARLFPSFWGPILGRCRFLAGLRAAPALPAPRPSVLLPGAEGDLLVRELAAALTRAGLAVRVLPPKHTGELVPALLRQERPALFLCVNFRGLDPFGELFHLLDAARVPVCVWCVDNPFHLVSGLRSPFWTRVRLALTDASFAPALRLHGVREVLHLPLAACPELFAPGGGGGAGAGAGGGAGGSTGGSTDAGCPGGGAGAGAGTALGSRGAMAPDRGVPSGVGPEPDLGLDGRMVFVGRSQFPGREKFFAGSAVPRWQWDAARAMLGAGGRPDYHWWAERLAIWPLWPGAEARRIGAGADAASRELRAACLEAAAPLGLTVYGDQGWAERLPAGATLRPPVDYYTTLPAIYRQAAWTLNATSLLLPHGLTQRHFDVWAAGGLLLTDATPGLSLFPEELVREVRFATPADLPTLARRLAPGTPLRHDIQTAWRTEILTHHTYTHRVAALREWLGV
ncbi:glycosyltransferase family protein [Desulfocurvus vexinensis]|uniref:glycosyltransferase family protein n=1 Tax=Desulfocurvus vexinensis TaxID=399548 RepID=UPI00048B3B32|nr:glycosyltransferase [Desulfocurvus vexinensis]